MIKLRTTAKNKYTTQNGEGNKQHLKKINLHILSKLSTLDNNGCHPCFPLFILPSSLPTLYPIFPCFTINSLSVEAISQAMGFPLSSQYLFTLLISKLSQTISSSIFVLPFTFSFFLITKSYVFHLLNQQKPDLASVLSLYYKPLLVTHVCNFICLISANSTAFSLLFFAFNLFEGFGFSSSSQWILFVLVAGFLLYSFIVANAFIICNLALVSSAMEEHSGFLAILKACVLLRGRTLTGLTLAVVVNLALAAIEALFHCRVVRAYHGAGGLTGFPMALEGILIAYLYSVFVVVDTIVSFMFFKSCKTGWLIDQQGTCSYRIEIMEE